MLCRARVWSGVLCFLAGVLYSSAVLVWVRATLPWHRHLEAVLVALPWLLAALGSAALEVLASLNIKHTKEKKCVLDRKSVV